MSQTATNSVVLLNMGGPESVADVRDFLVNLFQDPAILAVPGGRIARALLSRLIISRRLERVQRSYAQIGGGSPLPRLQQELARLLEVRLGGGVRVHSAMRYSHPRARETLLQIPTSHKLILLSLYPHKCSATGGSSIAEAKLIIAESGLSFSEVVCVENYATEENYLATWRDRIESALAQTPYRTEEALVIFCAHGVPARLISSGDQYQADIHATVEHLSTFLPPGLKHTLAWQSRVGPLKWLEPDVREVVASEARQGTRTLVIVPVSFTLDNLETLFELDVELREQAMSLGVSDFRRVECPNTHASFVESLAVLVEQHLSLNLALGETKVSQGDVLCTKS